MLIPATLLPISGNRRSSGPLNNLTPHIPTLLPVRLKENGYPKTATSVLILTVPEWLLPGHRISQTIVIRISPHRLRKESGGLIWGTVSFLQNRAYRSYGRLTSLTPRMPMSFRASVRDIGYPKMAIAGLTLRVPVWPSPGNQERPAGFIPISPHRLRKESGGLIQGTVSLPRDLQCQIIWFGPSWGSSCKWKKSSMAGSGCQWKS